MIIRRAVKSDLSKVYLIEKNSFQEHWSKRFFDYFLDSSNTVFLVTVEDDILGYIIWQLESAGGAKNFEELRTGHLLNLAVREGYRRRGIASSLLERLFKEIASYKPVATYLEVACSNQAAVNLYLKFNFQILSVIPKYYRFGGDAYLMVKVLF
ncbi:MAG: GNAT family N-acetyltransferase [Candidatus Odinarchaeum yellowstonii]|uniref:GNAT family N-acetyltransferase n=1 Tax=Odinarchaeota yellowstonii (strain LCB_4) TaxID=1841599 RepID=A0AAF0D1Q5_ODILC|nr:MAG: GNAT family N-acetyltransferase [Candidatus Odinarchaeum yellowstonii]